MAAVRPAISVNARTAVATATRIYPQLDPRGIGPHDSAYPPNHHSFDSASGLEQVATALAYLAESKRTRYSIRETYGLKHKAATWGRLNGFSPYVSNGAFLAALIGSGRVRAG